MIRRNYILGILILVILLGCSPSEKFSDKENNSKSSLQISIEIDKYPITIKDDREKLIAIRRPPEKIVIVGNWMYLEILLDLDAGNRIIGIPDTKETLPIFHAKNVGNVWQPNIEIITSLQPDLILGGYGEVRQTLESLGFTTLNIGQKDGYLYKIEDIFSLILSLSQVLYGNVEKGSILVHKIKQEITKYDKFLLGKKTPSVAILYATGQNRPVYVCGSQTIENEIVVRAGGKNAFADISGGCELSFETLLLRNPEIILTDPQQIQILKEHPLLQTLSAIKNKKIYSVSSNQWVSSRVGQTFQKVVKLIHQ